MITVNIKKLLNGTISIRDYVVEKCVKEGVPLEIIHKGQHMILNPVELKTKKFQLTQKLFKSRYGGPNYFLYDYQWQPNEN